MTGAHRLLAWGAKPLGAIAAGVIATVTDLTAVFASMAALALSLLVFTRGLSE